MQYQVQKRPCGLWWPAVYNRCPRRTSRAISCHQANSWTHQGCRHQRIQIKSPKHPALTTSIYRAIGSYAALTSTVYCQLNVIDRPLLPAECKRQTTAALARTSCTASAQYNVSGRKKKCTRTQLSTPYSARSVSPSIRCKSKSSNQSHGLIQQHQVARQRPNASWHQELSTTSPFDCPAWTLRVSQAANHQGRIRTDSLRA